MKIQNLDKMTMEELGRQYWSLEKRSRVHALPQERSSAAKNTQTVLDEFQQRLLDGATGSIDDFKPYDTTWSF